MHGRPAGQQIQLLRTAPALFAENQGQWEDPTVLYAHDGAGPDVAMGRQGIRFQVFRSEQTQQAGASPGLRARMRREEGAVRTLRFSASFPGSNAVAPRGLEPSETVFNYCVGDKAAWREGVPTYQVVAYEGLYDGIDLHTWGRRDSLKYEFHVAPGADYSEIRIRYEGIQGLSVAEDGSLVVELGEDWGRMVDEAPYIYQLIDGEKVEVAGQFALLDSSTYGFALTGAYDPTRELVIDPVLDWSTYLGGAARDSCSDIAVDGSGNMLVAGQTESSGWVSGGYDTIYDDGWLGDAFVAKLSASGGHVWSTYLGGERQDGAGGVALDGSGGLVVVGTTESSGWVSEGFDITQNGEGDGFAVRLTDSGGYVWGTYLGGSDWDSARSVAIDGGEVSW